MSTTIAVRLIDRRAQRFGAGLSAVVLALGVAAQQTLVVAIVGIALAVGSALGTRFFVFGRPWPLVRRSLKLGPPTDVEPELGPRFAQALGAAFVSTTLALLTLGLRPWAWGPAVAVVVLQTLLAATGFCLGCRLYGMHWWLPETFDRLVLRRPRDPSPQGDFPIAR